MLCLTLLLVQSALAHMLYVDGDASTDTSTVCGNLSSPCPTLEAALDNTALDSVTVQVLSSTLTLNDLILVNRSIATAFHLRGCDPDGTLITCSTETMPGLVFLGLDNVTISDIHISGCGALWNYRNLFVGEPNTTYRAAIHLHRVSNASITNLNATNNHGAGLAIVDLQRGTVIIADSHFTNNRVPKRDRTMYAGGGGIFVREGREAGPIKLELSHCTFDINQATSTRFYTFLNVFNRPHSGTGRGGGLDIVLQERAINNSIKVSHCSFERNSAYLGGGLAIQLYDDTGNNHISIEHSEIAENGCDEEEGTGSGGGAHFGYSFTTGEPYSNNFSIKNITFRGNCAEQGGGMAFFTSRSNLVEASLSNMFSLDNCTWIGNEAYIGAAVDISPHTVSRTQAGFLPLLVFKNSTFIENRVLFRKLDLEQSFGSGALFSSLINLKIDGLLRFERNTGSALVVVNAILDFTECDAVFVGNTGVQGGAISLTGVSAMIIGPGRTYNFTDNSATDRGGAIYNYLIDDHDFAASRSCFILYSDDRVRGPEWNVSFHFLNNTAGTYGHAIFSSSISSCTRTEQQLSGNETWNTSLIFRWPEVFYYDNRTTENQIATECGSFYATEPLPFHVIPGHSNKLGITTIDDIGQEIETIFRASIMNASNESIHVDDAFSCLTGNYIELKGEPESSGRLLLQTISSRKNSIVLSVTLLPCPPGFVMTGNECTCSIDNYAGIVSCDLDSFQANIKMGYWAGYVENNTFVTGICPLTFCSYSDAEFERVVPLPNITNGSHLDEYICGPTRSGILCGSCKPGYSVFYHSPNYSCHRSQYCKWGWLFYILSELVPVTVLFAVILTLNINFTSGRISGFILFSQLLDSVIVNGSGVVQYPQSLSVLSWGYQLIYGVFTMEFFNIEPFSFCLWEGATVLDVLAFRYVTIVYAFLLVLVTLLLLKYCGHMLAGKYVRITTIKNSVVHGLSAFIILCYAQTTKVSIYLLISGYVRKEEGEILSSQVFFNGDIGLFSTEHLPYALPAFACLMTISIIPPVLLILYPSVNKILAFCKLSDAKSVKRASRMVPISKLKPFLDSFQGCFKDHLRFFAGIYFLYRWIALLMFALVPTITGFYMSLGIAYILVLMLHTVCQPYASRVHNIVDGCLLANLAIIYSITGYNYLFSQGVIETYEIQSTYIATTSSIQLILIYLPIIGMAVYLAFLLCQSVTHKSKRKRTSSAYVVVKRPRIQVTSTDIEELLNGPDEFPPRMLEANYETFHVSQSSNASSDSMESRDNASLVDTPL